MAEETNVPEEGVKNLTQKSEFIAPAEIGVNLYRPIVAPTFDINNLNTRANVDNPALRVKDGTSGSAPYHPKSVQSTESPKFDGIDALFQKTKARISTNVDNNAYSKIYGYDASPKGAHKARYKAYGQETYDKIGFSPEIDNETWFNANTTMYDDWKRMATQAAWPMMKLGFMAPLHSYGKLLGQADIGQDIAEARDYEEYNAIGYSTKGGIGGFMINLQNSAAYSVGILAESVVEGALIGAAVGAVGGEGVGAAPGAVIGGLAEGFGSLLKLPGTLFNMSKNLGKMTMNLKKFEKISEVRNLFGNAGKSMGNFINPISNTSEAAMKYVFKNPDDLSNLARSARTVGALWHDVKNMNAALSEGRLEGGFTEQRVFDELYNKYYEKYGVAPSDELQKDMRKQAKVAGYQNTWKNTLLVHYSNNIAFPSIARAGFMKGLPTFSKTVGKVGPFQLVYDPAKKVASELAYSAEKVSLRNAVKAFTKPAAYGKTALNYFKANLVEGFQETAQDVLSDATENYYINSFKNKDRQNFEYSMATLNGAMKKQISAQGLETFASGFAMGSILGIPGGVKDFMSVGYNKYFKHRNNYDEYIQKRQDEVDTIVDALNTMDKGAKNFFDPRLTNYTTQMLAGKVADDPEGATTKEAKDTSFAAFQSAVRTSLRTGTFDMFLKNYEGYKQATPEELEQAWRLQPGQGQKALLNIDKSIANAKTIAARWQYTKNKFPHVVNPANFKDDTPEKEMAEVYNEAYLAGIDNLVFMGSAFDNNAERLDQMYSKLSSIPVIQNSRFSEIATITDPARLTKEIAMLRTEIELSKNAATPEAKEQYEKQKDLLDKLTSFQKEQSGVTVDFFKRIMNAQKTIMQTEGISANEAQVKAVDQVTKEFEDEGLHPFESYKTSFRDLLDTLAGSEENKANLGRQLDDAGGFDDIFEILADTHLLRDENMRLNKFINVLNSPQDFYEHVQRNFEWMKKLYNNRQDHYDELINNSMTAIQRNTLLEELAEKGIYVDLEEFAEWCQDNSKLPTYFVDQVNKRIINKDSYIYDKYIEYFDLAKNAETTNAPRPKSTEEQKLERTIDNYNNQREGELETVKNQYDQSLKDLLGYTQEEIDEMRDKAMFDADMTPEEAAEELELVKKAIKQLDSDNHLEIEAVFDLATENDMFTPQEYNMAKEDLFSDEDSVNEMADLAEKFTDAEEEEAMEAASNVLILKPLLEKRIEVLQSFVDGTAMEGIPNYEETQPYKDYTEAVDEINTKYDGLIDDARAEFDKAVKEGVESTRPEAMKKSIQEVQELFAGKEDIVQTKRNYIIDGEVHERMSNRIKAGHDTYGYTGEKDLMDLYDETIGAALKGERPKTTTDAITAPTTTTTTAGLSSINDPLYLRGLELSNVIKTLEKDTDIFEKLDIPFEYKSNLKSSDFIKILQKNLGGVNIDLKSDLFKDTFKKSLEEFTKNSSLKIVFFGLDQLQIITNNYQYVVKGQDLTDTLKKTIDLINKANLIEALEKRGFLYGYNLIETFYDEKSLSEAINKKEESNQKRLTYSKNVFTINNIERSIKEYFKNPKFEKELRLKNKTWGDVLEVLDIKNARDLYKKIGGYESKIDDIYEYIVKQTNKIKDLKKQDDAELAALGKTTESRELDQDLINEFIEALVAADLPGVNTNKYTVDVVRDELETLIKTDGTKSKKIQRYISKLKSQLSDIENKLASVKDKDRLASLQKQKAELEQAIKDEEAGKFDEPFEMTSDNIKSFILNTVKENAYEESRDAGNIIDPMLKDYLDTATSVKPKWDPKKMSKEAYDALFDDETGYLTELKRRADAGEIYIFTKNLIVHANDLVDADGKKLPPVAGEIDMIIVDRKGNKFIVDLKTGKVRKWFNYKTIGTDSFKKQLENTLQQVGYANLAEDMSGQQFGVKILPIEIGFDSKGYIVSAGKPTNPSMFTGEEVIGDEGSEAYTIGLDPTNMIQVKKEGTNVYENISIEDFMQKLIPVRRVPGSKRPKLTVKKEVSIPEEEREFVDDFMNKLANAGQAKPSGKSSTAPIRKAVVTIEDAIGKTVYYNGKPYTVNKEGVRYVLESESTVIELDTTASENLSDLGIDYFEGEFYTPKYDVTINSENSVTVDGTTYEIRVNESGNVIGLSPENKPEQVIKNERLLVAVEIERNKTDFITEVEELEDVDYAETMNNLKANDPAAHQKLELLEGVYNKNWNETVESGLSKLYSKQELNDSERLAVDLWVTDAIISMTKLYTRQSDEIYAKGLDNLEIINTLLYEGYNEQFTEVSANEPAKRTVKQTESQKQRKPGKNVTETNTIEPVQETAIEDENIEDSIKEDTFEQILELYAELDKAKPKLSEESYNMLKEQLDARASLLFDETGNIVLKTGEIYIFTAPVKDEQVAQGYRVKIDSFDPMAKTVTVSNVGPGNNKTFTMSIKDFNDSAMSEELINNMPKEDEPYVPSEEELDHLTESMAVTDGQLSDFEQLAKWEDEASADTISLDDLKNDFFNNFKC